MIRDILNKLTVYEEEQEITEGALEDALNDVNREGEGELVDIANDYGIDPQTLHSEWQEYKIRLSRKQSMDAGAKRDSDRRREQEELEKEAIMDFFKDPGILAREMDRATKKRAPYYVMSDGYYDDKQPVSHDEITALGNFMQTAAGEAFPDGDPNDLLTSYFRRKGWDAYDAHQKLVPAAAKKVLGTKSYIEYLANMWDEVYADAEYDAKAAAKDLEPGSPETHMYDMMGGPGADNPWR